MPSRMALGTCPGKPWWHYFNQGESTMAIFCLAALAAYWTTMWTVRMVSRKALHNIVLLRTDRWLCKMYEVFPLGSMAKVWGGIATTVAMFSMCFACFFGLSAMF